MKPPIPKEFWDDRFSGDEFAYGDRASRLLMGWCDVVSSEAKTALVPACGEGRDAVYLASLGLDVTAVDMSELGLAKTEALAKARGVMVKTVQANLFEWDWPDAGFDVVASMFAHMPPDARPKLHALYKKTLKPGGLIFIEGFSPEQIAYQKRYNSGGPQEVDMLYAAGMIQGDFDDLETLAFWTGVETLNEGKYHTGPAALLRAVFRKDGD
ncbi:class I SAM-dependent methyltransferase [Henriciella sp. AS95]|uniref:class I SAM-dependent methyltransferase n=1 Tax=Henriciella sp. AS95 TaxID=3135782 RepID=UPI00317A6417